MEVITLDQAKNITEEVGLGDQLEAAFCLATNDIADYETWLYDSGLSTQIKYIAIYDFKNVVAKIAIKRKY